MHRHFNGFQNAHVLFEPIRKILRWLYTGPLCASQATKRVKLQQFLFTSCNVLIENVCSTSSQCFELCAITALKVNCYSANKGLCFISILHCCTAPPTLLLTSSGQHCSLYLFEWTANTSEFCCPSWSIIILLTPLINSKV